nr:SNF2-related protein [Sedimentisphaera salicampi]
MLPAFLRKQWQQELESKFFLPTFIIDSNIYKKEVRAGNPKPFKQQNKIILCSYNFASRMAQEISMIPWDLAVIDEAHRMRNVYKTKNKMAKKISNALGSCSKLLLTATPLQNSLMELYGIISVLDEHAFGDAATFRQQFINVSNEYQRNLILKDRIKPFCSRTLRKQVVEYVPFTKRILITQEFIPTPEEAELYDIISAYLKRDRLIALPQSQRTLITLVLRKLLASSSFAITGTLHSLIKRLQHISEYVQVLDDEDLEGIDEYADELEEDQPENYSLSSNSDIDPEQIKEETDELKVYLELSQRIKFNTKGNALKDALKAAFEKAEELGASRKAVIFTESRRTQQYLYDLLSESSFEGKLWKYLLIPHNVIDESKTFNYLASRYQLTNFFD